MAIQNFYINGVQIKSPPNFMNIEKYNITNSGRTADGNMKMDFIAQKNKFILFYPVLSTQEVNLIESLIYTPNLFFRFTYTEDNVEKTKTVYTGQLTKIPAWRDSVWYWKDYEVHLIEQ